MENFQIRSYGKSELALCYSPDITESAARRKLMRWIDRKPGLMGAMRAAGYNELSHTFLPLEVKLIVEALGSPEDAGRATGMPGILREHWKIHGNTGITTGDAKRRRRRSRRRSFFSHTRTYLIYACARVFFVTFVF